MHKCTNAQMHKRTSAQVHKCTNAQVHKCTNAKRTNAQIPIAQMHKSQWPHMPVSTTQSIVHSIPFPTLPTLLGCLAKLSTPPRCACATFCKGPAEGVLGAGEALLEASCPSERLRRKSHTWQTCIDIDIDRQMQLASHTSVRERQIKLRCNDATSKCPCQ